MHRQFRAWLAFGAAALVVALAWPVDTLEAQAQSQAPGGVPRIWAGAYTEAQAARGKEVYSTRCVGCHNRDLSGSRTGPPLMGAVFMGKWDSQVLQRVYRIIRETMPRNDPGTLDDQTAVDLLALILQSNGFPAGSGELRASADVLEALTIVPKEGPANKEVPNFSLVQSVGCLVEDSPGTWRLTQATDPIATKDAPGSAPDLKEAESTQPGTLTLRLVSLLPFKPETHLGARVLLKEVINRYPGEDPLVNVTGLQAVAAGCRR